MSTTGYLSPISLFIQAFNNYGIVLAGGQIFTYVAGTTTPVATYPTSAIGAPSSPNGNPIVLDASGRLPVEVWIASGTAIKCVVTDSSGNILANLDNLPPINDPLSTLAALASPASGSGVDLVANATRSYINFAAMRAANVPALASGATLIVVAEGQGAVNDGLGGAFYWSASSTAADDNFNVIQPGATPAGRYLRLVQPTTGPVTIGTFSGSYALGTNGTGTISSGAFRPQLSAPLTLYVSATGADTSDGLTSVTAFLTVQHAIDVILNKYDTQGFNVTVSIGTGSFVPANGILVGFPPVGGGAIIIVGNGSANTTLGSTAAGQAAVTVLNNAVVQVQSCNITSTLASGLYATQDGVIQVGAGVAFGACGMAHIAAFASGNVQVVGNYIVNGNAVSHWTSDGKSIIYVDGGLNLTFNSPTFTETAQVENCSLLEFTGTVAVFSGAGATTTGNRYNSNSNSVIQTQGSGGTYLPGSTAGATASGGQYL